MSNVSVNFSTKGNDVLSFMERVREEARRATKEMLESAREQAEGAKEQMRFLEDEIKLLERRNRVEAEGRKGFAVETYRTRLEQIDSARDSKMAQIEQDFASGKINPNRRDKMVRQAEKGYEEQATYAEQQYKDELKSIREQERQQSMQTRLMREQIDVIRVTARDNLAQLRAGNEELVDELDDTQDPLRAMAGRLAIEQRLEETPGDEPTSSSGGWKQVGGAIFSVDNLNRLNQTLSTLTNTQNGFDMIGSSSSLAGQVIGGVIGGVIGTLVAPGGGTVVGAGLGASIGSTFGNTIGEFEQRRGMAAQEFLRSQNRYTAVTQQGISGVPDMTAIGVSASEYLEQLRTITLHMGTAANAIEQTNDVLMIQKATGIDQGVLGQFLTLFRGTQKDVGNLVAGVKAKGKGQYFAGGDYTFLSELVSKMGQLQQNLMATQEQVSTGTTLDILSRFDRVGGQFATKDFRSMGLIGQVNQALINPQSDSLRAMSLMALQKNNPSLGISQLLEEQQKGLASPEYLRSLLESVQQVGGDEDFQVMNFAGALGLSNNIAAARRLYNNRQALMSGKVSQDQLEEMYRGDYTAAAESRTTPIEKNMAEIKNGLLMAWYDSVDAMAEAFGVAMENAFAGATIELNNGQINFGTSNSAPSARQQKGAMKDKTPSKQQRALGLNADGSLNRASSLNKG